MVVVHQTTSFCRVAPCTPRADCAGAQVFRGLYSPQTVQAIRDIIEPEFEEIFRADTTAVRSKLGAPVEGGDGAGRNAQMGGLLGHPLWPQLEPFLRAPWHNDMVLNFLELLFGPFVQLDAFGITGTPAHAYPIGRRGTLVDQGWHRDSSIADRYQSYGVGTTYAGSIDGYSTPKYKPPNGMNLLIYLQDTTDTTGALRIIQVRVDDSMSARAGSRSVIIYIFNLSLRFWCHQRSHLGQPPTPSGDSKRKPHPQEQLLDVAAGDLIVMHGECIHAGTCNTSDALRAYISTFVTQVGYPHR